MSQVKHALYLTGLSQSYEPGQARSIPDWLPQAIESGPCHRLLSQEVRHALYRTGLPLVVESGVQARSIPDRLSQMRQHETQDVIVY